jgi:glycosyltransferase involved in cell wall biosynthesis
MNILIITPVYPHSGNSIEGIFNEQHALAIKELGLKVTVILCKPWIPDVIAAKITRYKNLKGLPQSEERNGIEIFYARYFHIPQYYFMKLTVFSCAQAILKTVRRLGNKTFDVIQVHSVWPVGFAAPYVSSFLKIPFVLTLHIEDDPQVYDSKQGRIFYKNMFEKASKVVAVGSPLIKFIQRIIPSTDSNKILRIPNGIDLDMVDSISKEPPAPKEGPVVIISVCNLWHVKGIDLNMKALAMLYQRGIQSWVYTIVGDGPKRLSLEKLSKELGINDKVHFAGRLPHREALHKIREADICCMPSRNESFGLVFLEAMACGKAAIGCFETGAEDLILNNKTGILVQKEDIESLSAALEKMVTNPSWARELGEAGRKRAEEFSWKDAALRYADLYHSMINNEKSVAGFSK